MYKCMTLISKNLSIDKVADTTNKYNNAYHSMIKMKSVDVESSTHIDFVVEKNDENPKLVGGYMLLAILTGEEIVVTFYEKELQKHIKKNLG